MLGKNIQIKLKTLKTLSFCDIISMYLPKKYVEKENMRKFLIINSKFDIPKEQDFL